ncbi:daxx-like protein [Vanessa cardui]|uniref:daxx-like protein n=1 Tax=Vanessa cardui TaxID=171605 RepID=UPI001F131D8F|nr:daxx-like protein [Vanessa cardui]
MASEDVIELGSSDDESQPAPKKKKPMPNAMVHIPTKLPGVTIKPAKFNLVPAPRISSNPSKPFNVPKGILSKPIMIGKSNISFDRNISKYKPTPAIRVPILKTNPKAVRPITSIPSRNFINPISIAKNLKKPELVIKKLASNKKLKTPAGIQGPRLLNNLPPGITIKPLAHAGASGFNKPHNASAPKNSIGEILTVEIDDEEAIQSSIGSPQWYLRPEEQLDNNLSKGHDDQINRPYDTIEPSLEEQNNKEPDTKNFVEITIEDSPVKPLQLRERNQIGKELAITIEDSPVKLIETKDVDSDGESGPERVPQSKKKLEYPRRKVNRDTRQVVEIEIDLMETGPFKHNNNEDISNEQTESNTRDQDCLKPDDENVISNKEAYVINDDSKDNSSQSGDGEFHPVYQNFIEMCFELENSEDMKKIVEKKIKAYYKQCPKEYVESEEFTDMVSSKIVAMKAAPGKMYLFIKDVVDELNLQRKMKKSIGPKTTDIVQDKVIDSEESEYDSKRQKQIRKLEKTIKKLHRAIQKLEEQEVDFEDDEDSVYLLTERYKERMVRVHAKFCQLTNTKMPSEPRINLEVRPGRPAGPVRKLEKWVNKKVPIGTPLPFPDFHDVIHCVREANEEDNLGWNEVDIMEEARDLFTRCGKKLQRRRQENEWRLAISRISHEVDPAGENVELQKKLEENQSLASKKETELLNKYVDRQNQLKLVAEEIGDKEAEESPVESEEEELVDDSNSLVNTEKRKERLKRLLQEKNRKTEEKENNPTKEENSNIKSNENLVQSKQAEGDTKLQENSLNKLDIQDIDAQDTEASNVIENIDENTSTSKAEYTKGESDENEFESDIDELHLLQKLHSGNESDASTLDSSDSDTPIAISDTLESDSDSENKKHLSDVISIENSSYSESEVTGDGFSKEYEVKESNVENLVSSSFEVEYFSRSPGRKGNENIIENILLASSDDDSSNKDTSYNETCINLKDDDISFTETTVVKTGLTINKNLYETKSSTQSPVVRTGLTINKNLFENNNALENRENVNINEQGNKQAISHIVDSIMEVADDSGDQQMEEAENRSISDDVNSVESLDTQIEQNQEEINLQMENYKNIESYNIELSGESVNDTQNDIIEANYSPANIETGNDNTMETE